MQWDKVTLFCFFASYLVALVLESSQFLRPSRVVRWTSLGFTAAGLLAQTAYLVVRSRQHDLPPLLGSPHDWLLVFAWLIVVLYLGIQIWNRSSTLGVFFLPVVLLMVGAARFASDSPNPRVVSHYWWSMLHATLLVFGILGVAMALIVSLMYLVQHYRLKHKQAELPALHLFSLERLGRLNWWLIIISVPLLTIGMAIGLWMTYLSRRGEHPVNLVSLAFAADGAVWIAMALLFGWMLTAKHAGGRVIAGRTILACAFLLATLLILKLLSMDGIHGAAGTLAASVIR